MSKIETLKKIKENSKYIITIFVFFALVTMQVQAQEQKEYICVDKGITKTHPPVLTNTFEDTTTALCSNGKVPKATKNIKIAKKMPPSSVKDDTLTLTTLGCTYCYAYAGAQQSIDNVAIIADMTVENPNLSTYAYHSLAEIATMDFNNSIVEVGWTKDPFINSHTTLFIYYWVYGTPKCYNAGCGWVQDSNVEYPGEVLATDHSPKIFMIEYWEGDWWVWYNHTWMGYYPGSLWGNGFTKGTLLQYFGEVSVNGNIITSTDMGNGLWSSNTNAARIEYMEYLVEGDPIHPRIASTTKFATNPSLYTVTDFSIPGTLERIRYGGPGSS